MSLVSNEKVKNFFDCVCETNAQKKACDKQCVDEKSQEAPKHYDNSNGSLYLFAEQQGLNAWEFDVLKRLVRCRKKGNFREDLEKTKFLIDLYLKEYGGERM